MSIDVVVAKFREDVSWTKKLPSNFNVIIYKKGDEGRPNVGREAETYLHHIVENYDRLADKTAFCQGHPWDHFYIKKQNDEDAGVPVLIKQILEAKDCACLGNLFTEPVYSYNLPVPEYYEYMFGEKYINKTISFAAGAQYVLSREQIHKRPREYYAALQQMMINHANAGWREVFSPTHLDAWVIERVWMNIFCFPPDYVYKNPEE